MQTEGIRRIGNWSNAFSCEVLMLIRRISLVGYGVLVKNQQSSNIFVLAQIMRLLACRHSGKEKVTMDDLFLLHSMDGGARVDVPWHVANFFTNKAKGYKKKSLIIGAHLIGKIARSYGLMTQRSLRSVTLGPKTSLLSVAKLVDMGICRYNGLGYGEMVDDLPDNGEDEAAKARVGEGQDDDEGGVNFMSNTPIYSTASSSSPNPFNLFGDANAGSPTSQNQGNDMDEE
ncbi:hypothetical protein Tco_1562130 [Tanacetum coccineum]